MNRVLRGRSELEPGRAVRERLAMCVLASLVLASLALASLVLASLVLASLVLSSLPLPFVHTAPLLCSHMCMVSPGPVMRSRVVHAAGLRCNLDHRPRNLRRQSPRVLDDDRARRVRQR